MAAIARRQIPRRAAGAGPDLAPAASAKRLDQRPKTGFVLPFDRWIRRRLKDAMDQTLRDPQAVAAAGLDPAAVGRLWRPFLDGAPGMYWSRVWSVYVIVRWCHRNQVFR
jgi:asparagine synthase (glutamine-hydrolysing)